MVGPARLPAVPQPARDVRARAALGRAARAAARLARGAPGASATACSAPTSRSPCVVGGLCWLVGWQSVPARPGPALLLTGAIGIWLFYVQHQFEDTYWETREAWSYDDAALRGSSYLKLPRILQFFTGNIGFHHVHHLSARIPNYNLKLAHEGATGLQAVPTLTLWEGLRAPRWKLWDEERGRLVTFREARSAPSPEGAASRHGRRRDPSRAGRTAAGQTSRP